MEEYGQAEYRNLAINILNAIGKKAREQHAAKDKANTGS